MSTEKPPKDEEISLSNIDELLAAEDLEFTQSMEQVKQIEPDQGVVIEASVHEEALSAAETQEKKPNPVVAFFLRLAVAFKNRVLQALISLKHRLTQALIDFAKNSYVFLKTRPKEFALYSFAMLRVLAKKALIPVVAFRKANRWQRVMAITLFAVVVASIALLAANLRGVWLPQMIEPVLTSFAGHADRVEEYDPVEGTESFYAAFPEERYEYLFPKIKVNLRRTAENPNPMGAFEIVVAVDSRDTAIEVRDREVEFYDLVQRVFEGETFAELATELGKSNLKARIKREMNQLLSQGWVREVAFKTFVLKP